MMMGVQDPSDPSYRIRSRIPSWSGNGMVGVQDFLLTVFRGHGHFPFFIWPMKFKRKYHAPLPFESLPLFAEL